MRHFIQIVQTCSCGRIWKEGILSDSKRSGCQLLKGKLYLYYPCSEQMQGSLHFQHFSSSVSLDLYEGSLRLGLFHEIWGC